MISRTAIHRPNGSYIVSSVAISIDAGTAVQRLQRAFGDESMICLDDGEGWCLGIGAAESVSVRSDGIVQTSAVKQPDRLMLDDYAFGRVPELLDDLGYADYRAYGWITFEAIALRGHRSGGKQERDRSPVVNLMIPRIELRADADGLLVRALDEHTLQAAMMAVTTSTDAQDHGHHDQRTAVPLRQFGHTDRSDHCSRIGAALELIDSGRVQKIVVTRRVEVPFRIDPAATFGNAHRSMSGSRGFLIMTGALDAVGVTPEVLLLVDAEGELVAELVAGTRPITGDHDRDLAGSDELRTDAKEQLEHAVCLAATEELLRELTDGGAITGDQRCDVGRYGRVQHLGSKLRGRLAPGVSGWDALGRLFPPLTLTGVPQLPAAELIGELEEDPRGPFSGLVVTSDADGSLEAAVMLRAVFQDADGAWLRAGGGIVPGSDLDREFDESTAKMIEIAGHLVPAFDTTGAARRSSAQGDGAIRPRLRLSLGLLRKR